MALQLDLTGALPANKVPNEPHNVALQVDRYIVPDQGAFFAKGLVIRNQANNQILQPIVDYAFYEPVTDLWKSLGVAMYKIVHIKNPLIAAVTITYQAIGGEYQYTPQQLANELNGLLMGGSESYPFGHVVGMPLGGLPPELHLEDGQQIYDAGKLVLSVNHIRDALMNGDRMALPQVYQYITDVTDDAYAKAIADINAVNNRLNELEANLDQGVGDIIITDNPTDPAVRRGYGQFQLNPDVLLLGADVTDTIGDVVGLAAGTDIYARRTYIWSQVENLGAVSYALGASASTVNEGDTVTFTLTTTGLTTGTRVPYRITGTAGFDLDDLSGAALNGSFVLNSSGVGTLSITVAADNKTEGTEQFTIAITPVNNVKSTITINDTSKSPSLALTYSRNANGTSPITVCNEGERVYLVIRGTNIPDGHVFNINYGGSSQNDDFDDVRPTTVTYNGPMTVVPFDIKADKRTDGTRTMISSLSSGLLTTPVSATITVNDTSRAPVYTMYYSSLVDGSNSITSANEGDTVYLHLKTLYVETGTSFSFVGDPWNVGSPYAGHVSNGQGSPVVGDWQVTAFYGFGTPVENTESPLPNGTKGYVFFNEGFKIMADGRGTFSSGPNNGSVYGIPIKITADMTSEGLETLRLGLMEYVASGVPADGPNINHASVLKRASLTINDTSGNPAIDVGFYTNADGTGNKLTQINEGQTMYFVAKTNNVGTGTVYNLLYTGSVANADDFTTTLRNTITIGADGKASFAITVKNDYLTESTENLSVQVRDGGNVLVASTDINIMDTSVNSTATGGWFGNTAGTTPITSINEAQACYLHFTGSNMPPNATINLSYPIGTGLVDPTDFVSSRPATVTLNAAGKGYVSYLLKNDLKLEGPETFRVIATYAGVTLGTYNLTVNDTSVPTMDLKWSLSQHGTGSVTSVNEGVSFYLVLQGQGYQQGDVFSVEITDPGSVGGQSNWDGLPSPTATIDAQGWGIVAYKLRNNKFTDPARTLTATVKKSGVTVATANITVNDTSKTPTYSAKFAMQPSGNPVVNTVPIEYVTQSNATPVYFVIETTNVPDGTQLVVLRDPSDYNPLDFVEPVAEQTPVTINSNRGYITCKFASSNTQYVMQYQQAPDANTPIGWVNEGEACWLVIKGQPGAPLTQGTRFYLSLNSTGTVGNADVNDLTTALPAYIDVNASGYAATQINIKADQITEGTERLVIEVYSDPALTPASYIRTVPISLMDTSPQPRQPVYITSNVQNVNLWDLYVAAYGAPLPNQKLNIIYVINAGVTVSSANDQPSIRLDSSFAPNAILGLDVLGTLVGPGGKGGWEEFVLESGTVNRIRHRATNGGPAIGNYSPVRLNVWNVGLIASGGGGGGLGEATTVTGTTTSSGVGGGGAGGGSGGQSKDVNGNVIRTAGNGTVLTGGSGTDSSASYQIPTTNVYVRDGAGGKGGDYGQAGTAGYKAVTATGSSNPPANVEVSSDPDCIGGNAGPLFIGDVVVTTEAQGTVRYHQG